jgi:outer membrane protein assembly factor BamD (BamD/ComL family)
MINFTLKEKIMIAAAVVLITAGVVVVQFYQPPAKADAIYSQALEDEKNGDFANAYYLFGKIKRTSQLKPPALFHQAQNAAKLDDKKSVMRNYKALYEDYPLHKLGVKAKYLYAIEIVESNPAQAKKYFEEFIEKYPDTECAIAAEYFLGQIIVNKYKGKPLGASEKAEAENHFRHYLEKAPAGRWGLNAVTGWLSVDENPNPDDKLLMARVYYIFADYENADKILSQLDPKESWTLNALNLYAFGDYLKVKQVVETGLKDYAKYVKDQDVYDAIDKYFAISGPGLSTVNYLLNFASDKGADYLWYLKCSAISDKEMCYANFYNKYPNGKFSAEILANLFFEKVRKGDYDSAKKIGKDYLTKFPHSNSSPFVLFWLGKIAQRQEDYKGYNYYYQLVIAKYPDSYYAYRAYLNLHHIDTPIISKQIKELPVEFPYKQRDNLILKLGDLKDYDIISELTDDDFIKSWVSYKKRDFTKSTIEARVAMEKLAVKPDRHDLRWRLIYPLVYFETIKMYANGNNAPLMQSILREESYFNPNAKSVTGARGLMQLMPVTADEVAKRYGVALNSPDELFNPALNVRLGSQYYLLLKGMLDGKDISSIAAYNGGIGSVQRWKSSLNYSDTDEFVEQIPYPETQNYVKKVFRSYWNYVRIYGD